MITINGDMHVTIYGKSLDELCDDLPFDDDCECNCDFDWDNDYDYDIAYEDCDRDDCCEGEIEFDLKDNEEFADYTDEYLELLSVFVKEIYNTDGCPHCIATLLDGFLDIQLDY